MDEMEVYILCANTIDVVLNGVRKCDVKGIFICCARSVDVFDEIFVKFGMCFVHSECSFVFATYR